MGKREENGSNVSPWGKEGLYDSILNRYSTARPLVCKLDKYAHREVTSQPHDWQKNVHTLLQRTDIFVLSSLNGNMPV